jgi:fumarate reductase subunit C
MVYAVRGGLTGAEILGRTQGHWGFAAVLRVPSCWPAPCTCRWAWRTSRANGVASATRRRCWLARAFGLLLLVLGLRAVLAVFTGGL